MKLTIKTLFGFEDILSGEVENLGGKKIEKITRGVTCEGNPDFLYRANLSLRTAMSVLVPIYTFHAKNEKQLYDRMMEFNWSDFLNVDQTFAIDSVVFSKVFTHSKFVGLKAKDAMVDQYRNKYRRSPSVHTNNPDVLFNLHCANDFFTVSMDSSGAALNQRGYHEAGHNALMNEVLAAGMLILSGWDRKSPLIDPMCGNGTILAEAAMMAMNRPPNLKRTQFGFRTWPEYSPVLFNRIKSEELAKVRRPMMTLTGIDMDEQSVQLAKKALGRIGLRREIQIKTMDFRTFKPINDQGTIVTHPPYETRMGKDVFNFYKTLGEAFKQNFTGYDAWLISANKQALEQIGLKDSKRIKLYNGKRECDFCKYELY